MRSRSRAAFAGRVAASALFALAVGARAMDAAGVAKSPWRALSPGVQWAPAADLGADPAWAARVVMIDPQSARLSVQFDAARPTLAEWRARFPAALAIVNGSFYSDDAGAIRPTCDLVLAGKPVRGAGCRRQDALFFGAEPASPASPARAPQGPPAPPTPATVAPRARAGSGAAVPPTLEVQTAAAGAAACAIAGGARSQRLLAPAEFRAEEWAEALKSFPALVRGCAPACTGPHYCQERSRTAALAQRRDGKLLLFASQWPAVRSEVGRFLAETLGAAEAVNLDGGPEATLALRDESAEQTIGIAGTGLPLVLVLLPPLAIR